MFCVNCGKEIKDDAKFCEHCGAKIQPANPYRDAFEKAKEDAGAAAGAAAGTAAAAFEKASETAKDAFSKASEAAKDAFEKASETAKEASGPAREALNSVGSQVDNAVAEVERDLRGESSGDGFLKEDRSLLAYVLLCIITCGIYGYYFIYTVARDVNIACADDDEETAGLGVYILLSFVTCGFYNLYWMYKLGNRLAKNAPEFGLTMPENGTTIVLWKLLGALVCFIGSFVGDYILIKNTNEICAAWNRRNGR